MPSFLLTTGATVICAHGGVAQAAVPAARVRVNGQPALTMASPMMITGCASPMACTTATWVTSAARVRVQGVPAICVDSLSVSMPTGTPLAVINTQPRVKGS
jgi:hypothetical protein